MSFYVTYNLPMFDVQRSLFCVLLLLLTLGIQRLGAVTMFGTVLQNTVSESEAVLWSPNPQADTHIHP